MASGDTSAKKPKRPVLIPKMGMPLAPTKAAVPKKVPSPPIEIATCAQQCCVRSNVSIFVRSTLSSLCINEAKLRSMQMCTLRVFSFCSMCDTYWFFFV